MKKLYMIIATALIGGSLFAGGIVTNTNQSAQFVRMLSRNATYQIDAVYFNPAGVTRLSDGFHLSFNNQSIFKTQTVTTTFPELNNGEYIGDIVAPLFPSFFAAYKKDKIGISFGFGPNGGGGSAEYLGGFIERYLMPLIYPEALTRELQLVLGGVLVAFNLVVYLVVWRRFQARKASR